MNICPEALYEINSKKFPYYLVDNPSCDINRVFGQVCEVLDGNIVDAELIVAGCSFTAGIGVPEGESWGDRLAEMLNVENYVNISRKGWNLSEIVSSVIEYIRVAEKKPKYVALLATELTRFAVAKRVKRNQFELDAVSMSNRSKFTHPPQKYAKHPYVLEDIVDPEVAIYQSLYALNMLINYCEASDIKLVWGTWDPFGSIFFDKVLERNSGSDVYLGNYVALPTYMVQWPLDGVPSGCHSEEAEQYGDAFNFGLDGGNHSGVHHHIHWAEEFHKRLAGV